MIFSAMTIEDIRHLAKQFDDGSRETDAIMARGYLEAYENGFKDGVKDTEERIEQFHALLTCTVSGCA